MAVMVERVDLNASEQIVAVLDADAIQRALPRWQGDARRP
jgi:hypothetical protein